MIEPIYPDRWIEQHAGIIFRTCRRITSSEDAAWEAFQETCLAFAKRKDTLDLTSDPERWLKETARRCSRAIVRRDAQRRGRQTDQKVEDITSEGISQIDSACLQETVSALHEELEQLSGEDRALLRCLYVDGMSHLNTARQLRCSAGSVHARAERVRGQLRRRMQRRGIAVGMLLLLFLLNEDAHACSPRLVPTKKPVFVKFAAVTALSILGALTLSAADDPATHPEGFASVANSDQHWEPVAFDDDTMCEIEVDFGYEDAGADDSQAERDSSSDGQETAASGLDQQQFLAGGSHR
ncbi:MAG: sigma-70 family RNA polymerase sigma factor [Planctomycetaceae bacterium]|nr:sigma-70 family RNA polymerase sigma factor [Planctomycetaceae bacterium]